MTRAERLVLMAFFVVLLSVLGGWEPTATAIGGVAGAGAGVAVAGRARRLSERMDQRLGPDDTRTRAGFALRPPAVRAGAHVVVLGGLLVTTGVLPFVGDELFAGSAAGLTALPLVLTAARLRR